MTEFEQYSISSNESKNYTSTTSHNMNFNTPINNYNGNVSTSVYYRYNDNRSQQRNSNATYSSNPFAGENNELLDEDALKPISLNRRTSESQSRSHQQSFGIQSNFRYTFDGNETFEFPHVNIRFSYDGNHIYGSSTERQQTDYLQYGDSVWSYKYELSPFIGRVWFQFWFGSLPTGCELLVRILKHQERVGTCVL